MKPSKSREESYRQAEGPGVGPSGPSIWMTAPPPQETPAGEPPMQETPAEEPPMQEAPVTGPSHPDTPAPMETGGAGDSQTWAEQVETSVEAEFQWPRPLKCPRSQSRKRETGQDFPFPFWMRRGGSPPLRNSTSMPGSSRPLRMMWLVRP